ncbi:hypothetical protein ACA910_019093 [Epithemia clementina (nom. ined.)]
MDGAAIDNKKELSIATRTLEIDSHAESQNCLTNKQHKYDFPRLVEYTKPLPSFVDRGGLMIFFHVAKNGGTTIREFLESYKHVQVVWKSANFIRNLSVMRTIVEGLAEDQQQTTVLEIHLGPDPTLPELEKAIHNLRERALVNKVPFFVFSTYREPLSYAISFYNYQNLGQAVNIYEIGTNSEADFKRLSLPSPQCLFFARGETATTKQFPIFGRNFMQDDECRETYQVMTRTIDWIGTVDNLQNETLPLLAYMLEGKIRHIDFSAKNKGRRLPNKIRLENLSEPTIVHIRNKTRADLEIFLKVQSEYSLERLWTNFPLSKAQKQDEEQTTNVIT